jgi:DTW domain-containing protein YfiP
MRRVLVTSGYWLASCHCHGLLLQGYGVMQQYSRRTDLLILMHNSDGTAEFLRQVEETVAAVLDAHNPTQIPGSDDDLILSLLPAEREAFGIARCLRTRLQAFRRNNDCPRCWLQRAHCICPQCPPLLQGLPAGIHRIFILMHHKEICLAVDTAKLIMASFPNHCRLVVAGIGPEYQPAMVELQQALTQGNSCLVLFPAEDAKTFTELQAAEPAMATNQPVDLVVIDGTWSQAQKMHSRYFAAVPLGGPRRIQLSSTSMVPLHNLQDTTSAPSSSGHQQLRRHPIDWRTIATMEATRLVLKEITDTLTIQRHGDDKDANTNSTTWETMLLYQRISNEAAQRQLGPPRLKEHNVKRQ